ncbi:(2Fe-2S)-binding protein [Pseudarthrobacter albicanus]|uniref:(2Fe-2S)-binding protein n=1 Tax=Pseudarthrobacter albicanus TaxID=2823873 RepID=UPI001BA752FD|nr:(2Fe-2S)-binding protein [Pseudarthrobacter albicanus]
MSTQAQGAAETPGGPTVELTLRFDGRPLKAAPGQSVGGALAAHGITAWRSTRKGARPRGLFCGIGVCFDCLVTVDGAANQRACLVEVRDGMQIDGSYPQAEGDRQ